MEEMPSPAEPRSKGLQAASASQDSTKAGSSTRDLDGNFTCWRFIDCWCPQPSFFMAPQSPGGVLADLCPKFDFQSNF